MRQLVAFVALSLVSTAHAEKPAKPARPSALDVSEAADKVDAYRDETGKLYVIPREGDITTASKWTFYGDGRSLYLQRVISVSVTEGTRVVGVWAPLVRAVPHAMLEVTSDGTPSIICRMRESKYERRPLTLLSNTETKKLLTTAKFYPPLWDHRVWFFGRSDGKYFLIDVLRDEKEAGHRMFVGSKGQMKPLAISDVTSDTAGAVITTKSGELEISADANGTTTWKQGKKRIELTVLDQRKNAYLIYRELGVYPGVGTFCEDQ